MNIPTKTLANRINHAHEQAQDHAKQAIEHAMGCGELLLDAKAAVKYGEWLPWLKANITIPERTVQHYMKLAANREVIHSKSATVADLTVNAAVALITTGAVDLERDARQKELMEAEARIEQRLQELYEVFAEFLKYRDELGTKVTDQKICEYFDRDIEWLDRLRAAVAKVESGGNDPRRFSLLIEATVTL